MINSHLDRHFFSQTYIQIAQAEANREVILEAKFQQMKGDNEVDIGTEEQLEAENLAFCYGAPRSSAPQKKMMKLRSKRQKGLPFFK